MIQTAMIIGTDGTLWAIELGTRKIADPTMVPTTIAVESNRPSLRGSSARFTIWGRMASPTPDCQSREKAQNVKRGDGFD